MEEQPDWIASTKEYSLAVWAAAAAVVVIIVVLLFVFFGGSEKPEQAREWKPDMQSSGGSATAMPKSDVVHVPPAPKIKAVTPAAPMAPPPVEKSVTVAAPVQPKEVPVARPDPVTKPGTVTRSALPAVSKPAPAKESAVPAGYYVQVGAFQDKAHAAALAKTFTGLNVHLSSRPNGLTGVWIGPYSTRKAAEKSRDEMVKAVKLKGFIVQQA